MPGKILGGSKSPVLMSSEERLAKLQASVAYGGRHVPAPRGLRSVEISRGTGRIRTLADITSKLKNETVASKAKKKT